MTLMMSSGRRRAAAVAPAFVTSPVISGTYSIGSVLTCAPGTWTGSPTPTPAYQWQRDGMALGGETASTYTLVGADMRGEVTCEVTITNGAGFDVDTSNALSWADCIAPLVAKCWVDAQGGTHLVTTGGLIDSATDLSGAGNDPAATGALRPTYDPTAFGGRGGIVFGGAQWMETPAFAVATGSTSGCCYWHPTADACGAFSYGATWNAQHVALFAIGGGMRIDAAGVSPVGVGAVSLAVPHRVVWRTVEGGATRVLIDGVVYTGSGAGTATATTNTFKLGIVSPTSFYRTTGAIGELIFADAVWSDAEMGAVDAALAARWS